VVAWKSFLYIVLYLSNVSEEGDCPEHALNMPNCSRRVVSRQFMVQDNLLDYRWCLQETNLVNCQ